MSRRPRGWIAARTSVTRKQGPQHGERGSGLNHFAGGGEDAGGPRDDLGLTDGGWAALQLACSYGTMEPAGGSVEAEAFRRRTPGTAGRRRGGRVRNSRLPPAGSRSPAVRSRARPNPECPVGRALSCGRTSRSSRDGGPGRAGGGLMSPAAEELRFPATADSAVCGRPGLVPDGYLDELDGGALGHPGADPAVLGAERCGAGIWERAEGGYRVLDEEAVQVCVDRVRELREEDAWLAGLQDFARSEPAVGAAGTSRFGDRITNRSMASFRCGECGEIAGVIRVARTASTIDSEPGAGGWLVLEYFLGTVWMRTLARSWTRLRHSSGRGTPIRSPSGRSPGRCGTSRRSTARNAGSTTAASTGT